MHELFYFQSALAHLAMALKLLDKLGAKIPAAHVDEALHSLILEPVAKRTSPKILALREADFELLDQMVMEMYGNQPRDNSPA
jgi:hypothetical protein